VPTIDLNGGDTRKARPLFAECEAQMSEIHDDRDHVISLVLSDADWKAFLRAQPQPVAWLHERIAEVIATSKTGAEPSAYTTSAR
jgi:hypothetical protein